MTARQLPPRPSLEQYRKQAKDLLRSYNARDHRALSRIREYHPRFQNAAAASGPEVFRLSDAQWVVAREHGFESWPKFAGHIRREAARASVSAHTGEVRSPIGAIDLDISTDEMTCALTGDGRRAVTSAPGHPVQVWAVETGRCVMALDAESDGAWAPAWSHDEHSIVFGARDGTVQIWNLERGVRSHLLIGHAGFVRCITLSSDGRRALSGCGHVRDPRIRSWDLESGRCLQILEGHSDGVYDVALDPSERRAVSGARDGTIRLWDVDSADCLRVFRRHSYHVHSVVWSADGRRILSSSRDIRLWDVESGACVRVFDQDHRDTIRKLALSADGRRALSASHDGTVRLWDVETGRCLRVLAGHPVGVVTVAWSTDERRAYSCDWSGGIRAWDLT